MTSGEKLLRRLIQKTSLEGELSCSVSPHITMFITLLARDKCILVPHYYWCAIIL